jgi:hypothetical protein
MKFGNRLIFGMAALVVAATVALTVTQMQGGGGIVGGKSGITGVTQAGPTCPVERSGQNCIQTVAASVVVYDKNGTIVAQTTSGNDGHFQVDLPAGTYTVQGFRTGIQPQYQNSMYPFGKSNPVTAVVYANQYTHVTVEFDTGIRVPIMPPSAQPLPYQGQ